MKKKTYKIIICISLVVMLFTSFGNVFGATNPDYTSNTKVSESLLDEKIKGNILLDSLANMINALASLVEYLIGAVFESLTGDNVFPWADRIIFNALPFLDINFLNPADNSLFISNGTDSILGKVVKQVYSTIFSLAVLFLGVAVGVMAIRLAISSIAAEKAKYKQAIVNWVTCIVMLFLMHYILAFVFWINEQMVRIASGILIQTIKDPENNIGDISFDKALYDALAPRQRMENYLKTMGLSDQMASTAIDTWDDETCKIAAELLSNSTYVSERLVYVSDAPTNFLEQIAHSFTGQEVMGLIGLNRLIYDVGVVKNIKNTGNTSGVYTDVNEYSKSQDYMNELAYAWALSKNGTLMATSGISSKYKVYTSTDPNVWTDVGSILGGTALNLLTLGISGIAGSTSNMPPWGSVDTSNPQQAIIKMESALAASDEGIDKSLAAKQKKFRVDVDKIIVSVANGDVTGDATDIIANLGAYFKKSAYVYKTDENDEITGWRATQVSVTGALIYAIFIFQSCMYLFMYVKRLFYVIMLSMFGPIVVIYDFFMKSAS